MTQSLNDLTNEYLEYDESSILLQVGQRTSMAEQDPTATAVPTAQFSVQYENMGIGDDLKELGKRVARRVFRELHNVLCGTDPDDQQERDKLRQAFGATDQAIAVAVAAVLAGPLGLGGAIAAALAALFVKRLLAPGIDETCKFWDEKLAAI